MAIRIGLSIKEYWDLTPAEFGCYVEAYRQKLESEGKKDMANAHIIAWNTANYSNAKRLPNIKNTLKEIYKDEKKPSKSKRMSKEEIEKHYNKKVVK